jgi:hypothetical protein
LSNKFILIATIIVTALALLTGLATLPQATAHDGVDVDVETCEALTFESDLKYIYHPGEPVYVRGKTLNKTTTLDIYLVADKTWVDGMIVNPSDRIPGTVTTVITDGEGKFGPLTIWNSAQSGNYDIFLDTNNNGVYNPVKDSIWDNNVSITAGFTVLPEYPIGVIAIFACLAAFVVVKAKRLL